MDIVSNPNQWDRNYIFTFKITNMNSSKIIVGLLSGVIIGLLIAPRKGSETRKKIVRNASAIADAIQDGIETVREQLNDAANDGIESIANFKEDIEAGLS
jgi:gas vesicle protein